MKRKFSTTNEASIEETETKVDLGTSHTGTTTVSKRHATIISNQSANDTKKLDSKDESITVSTSEMSDEDLRQ